MGQVDHWGVESREVVSFGVFALRWLRERESEHQCGELALATLRSYRRSVVGILIPMIGELPITAVDIQTIRDLRAATVDIPARGNQVMNLTRRILAEAERLGLRRTGSNPSGRVKRHPEMASARPAPPEAVKDVFDVCEDIRTQEIDVCHPTLAAMFQIIALTGARPSEIRDLRWDNVYLDEGDHGVLRLRRHKTVRRIGEKRIVLSARARRVIDELNPHDPTNATWVFPSYRKPWQPYRDIGKAWRRVAEYAGFGELCLRDLRSGLATNAYDNGVPMEQVQEMLAHASITTTRRYTRISARRVGASYDAVENAIFRKQSKDSNGGRDE